MASFLDLTPDETTPNDEPMPFDEDPDEFDPYDETIGNDEVDDGGTGI